MEYSNENIKKDKSSKIISVIVPVYNSEKYIRETIDSVIGQSYTNWEMIVINDDSVDNSAKIVEEFIERDQRIQLFSIARCGAGLARNEGLQKARGEYIVFLDADDYIPDRDIFQKYINIIESIDADIVVSNYARLWDDKILPSKTTLSFSSCSPLSEAFRFQGFFSVGTLSYVWGKMYRKAFLETNDIWFDNLFYSEDKLFNIQCYLNEAKYVFLQEIGYIYRKNEDSISWQYRLDSYETWMKMAHAIQNTLVLNNKTEYSDLVQNTIVFAVFFDGKMEYVQHSNSLRAIRKVIKKYSRDDFARSCFLDLAKKKVMKEDCNLWSLAIKGFAFCMKYHLYLILSAGMAFLINHKVDEKLSDTGLREQEQ